MRSPAVICGLSNHYSDGIERMEIWVDKGDTGDLPCHGDERVPVRLTIGARNLAAGIRSTPRNPYVWVCPDLYGDDGSKVRLADILAAAGFEKNHLVLLCVSGDGVRVILYE